MLTAPHHSMRTKNVARGWFEYSHSPDNRALTKPNPVTTYLVAKVRMLQPIPKSFRTATHVQRRYAARQVLIANLIKTHLLHQERELQLVRKLLDRCR